MVDRALHLESRRRLGSSMNRRARENAALQAELSIAATCHLPLSPKTIIFVIAEFLTNTCHNLDHMVMGLPI